MTPSHDPQADARALLRLHRPPRLWWLRRRQPLCVTCGQWCTRRYPCPQAALSRHQIARPDPCPPPNLGQRLPPEVARGTAAVPDPTPPVRPAAPSPGRHQQPLRPQSMYPWLTPNNGWRKHYRLSERFLER